MKKKNLIGHCIKGVHQVMVLDRERIIQLVTKQVGSNVWSYGQGRNSHMQADWPKTFECDAVIEHYYPAMPVHYVTTHLRIRNTDTSGFVCSSFMLGQR